MAKGKVIVMAGSAGSINVLIHVLPQLKQNFPLPIIVIVHRMSDSDNVLEKVLQSKCKLPVISIEDKMPIEKSTIYIAPGGYHLLLEKDYTFSLDTSEKVNYSRPSIDVAFESISEVYQKDVIAFLLTGSNSDGASGIKTIKDKGGYIIVQSAESSLMPNMPEAAELLVKFDEVLNPEEIAKFLLNSPLIGE